MLTATAAPDPEASEALDPRRQEILGSVRHVFAEKGFERASMQDLARAAGMSVGNFYRYFPSKAAMIEAIIERQIETTRQHFARITTAAEPLAALREALHAQIDGAPCGTPEEVLIWAEISIAALRSQACAAAVDRLDRHIADDLLRAIALSAGLSPEAARARFEGQALMALLLVKCSLSGTPRSPLSGRSSLLKSQIIRQLDVLHDEIGAARPKDVSA